MNPFTHKQAADGMAMTVVERARKRAEKRRDQMDKQEQELIKQQQEAAQAQQEQQQVAQQQQQEAAQQQQDEQQSLQDEQAKQRATQAANVSVAARTPSYRPYQLRKAASKLEALKRFLGNTAAGVGIPAVSDSVLYRGKYDSTADWLSSFKDPDTYNPIGSNPGRALGLIAGGGFGVAGARKFMDATSDKLNTGLKWFLGAPAAERATIFSLTDLMPRTSGWLDAQTNLANSKINASSPASSGGAPWGLMSALAAGGLGVYAWDKLRNKPKELNNRPDPDRVALEIPAHKISDGLYNHLGREILFKDKAEDERQLKAAAVAPFTPKINFQAGNDQAIKHWVDAVRRHAAENKLDITGATPYYTEDLTPGVKAERKKWLGLAKDRFTYVPEMLAGEQLVRQRHKTKGDVDPDVQGTLSRKWPTDDEDSEMDLMDMDDVEAFRKIPQHERDARTVAGLLTELAKAQQSGALDKMNLEPTKQAAELGNPNTGLTVPEARTSLSPNAFSKWFRDNNTPKGFFSTTERLAPTLSPLMGGPQLGNVNAPLHRNQVPLKPGKAGPFVQSAWADTVNQYRNGGRTRGFTGGGQVVA